MFKLNLNEEYNNEDDKNVFNYRTAKQSCETVAQKIEKQLLLPILVLLTL